MKKTIRNVVLSSLTTLALITSNSLADEPHAKKPEAKEPQRGILTEKPEKKNTEKDDSAKELLKQIESLGLNEDQINELEKALESGKVGSIITKGVVIGPDGKAQPFDPTKGGGVDLEKLLGLDDEEIKKLLADGGGAITSGKVVVIDENGKKTVKDLEGGQDLNAILQEALKGIELGDFDIASEMENGELLSIGPAFLSGNTDLKAVKADLAELRQEMKSQRQLLEKILKKLD